MKFVCFDQNTMQEGHTRFTLRIGNKNYSSWSMRVWLTMKYFQIPFEEETVSFHKIFHPEGKSKELFQQLPTGIRSNYPIC